MLDEVKKGGKKLKKALGWPDPSPVPAEVGGGAISGHGGVALHQLHRHVGAPAALPRLVGRPDPPLGVEWATLRQRLGVTNTPAIEVLSKEVSIPVDEPKNISRQHIIMSSLYLLSMGLHPPATLSYTILLLSQILDMLLML